MTAEFMISDIVGCESASRTHLIVDHFHHRTAEYFNDVQARILKTKTFKLHSDPKAM